MVRPGETIAFVGPSGAGKSTMLNLLLGFLRPTDGTILLDGVDAEEIDLRTYRRFLSVVPQESLLFDGTVFENVTYGMNDTPPEIVEAALRDANALDFVQALPYGWDTTVGDRGARLSGGQRQRLAIARALVRNPRVLLLDEATSALDSESEAQIQNALTRLMRGRTTFVVAHRLSTIRDADRVAVLSAWPHRRARPARRAGRRRRPLRAAARRPGRLTSTFTTSACRPMSCPAVCVGISLHVFFGSTICGGRRIVEPNGPYRALSVPRSRGRSSTNSTSAPELACRVNSYAPRRADDHVLIRNLRCDMRFVKFALVAAVAAAVAAALPDTLRYLRIRRM